MLSFRTCNGNRGGFTVCAVKNNLGILVVGFIPKRTRFELPFLIARNRGHFAPVINCQRNLIFKMADKNDRSQEKRISYDILNNLSSVDLFYDEKSKKKTSSKKILGVYQVERLIATKQDGDVSKTVLH